MITDAFKKIFKHRNPQNFQTDKGKEFLNSTFQKYLKENKVEFYTVNSELKACIVERFNRKLKEKMWRYFTCKNTYKYHEVLPRKIESYNSYHRTIKPKPECVLKKLKTKYGKIFTVMKNL